MPIATRSWPTSPGSYVDIYDHVADSGILNLTIPDFNAHAGNATDYTTRLRNPTRITYPDCTGEIRLAAQGLTVAHITSLIQRDFNGPGADLAVTFEQYAEDVLVGHYPDTGGFPIDAGLDGITTNQLTLAPDAPLGPINGQTVIRDELDAELGRTSYRITVLEAQAPPPDPDPEAEAQPR